jgi:hypothetical protein
MTIGVERDLASFLPTVFEADPEALVRLRSKIAETYGRQIASADRIGSPSDVPTRHVRFHGFAAIPVLRHRSVSGGAIFTAPTLMHRPETNR